MYSTVENMDEGVEADLAVTEEAAGEVEVGRTETVQIPQMNLEKSRNALSVSQRSTGPETVQIRTQNDTIVTAILRKKYTLLFLPKVSALRHQMVIYWVRLLVVLFWIVAVAEQCVQINGFTALFKV